MNLKDIKENYRDAKDTVHEQYNRIREDFLFSNPSDPKQWDEWAVKTRQGRPTHTLDRTNQFVQHVVNRQREAKTSADILPADSKADVEVAKKIKGIIRHIEYVSKADIAWDTASDHQARGGLGWVRVIPRIINPETNEQEIIIQRVHDPLSCVLDPNSTEPDGSDAMFGFVETNLTPTAFERKYPKAKKQSWETDGWFSEDSIRICEYFGVVEEKTNRITVMMEGLQTTLSEDEYWKIANTTGVKPEIIGNFEAKTRKVKWCKVSGYEILEETEYPSQWIGLVPVIGHEIWIDGKRYLCGLVRRLMDGQKLHNYEMSALTEALMVQPKAPFLIPGRALDGYEDDWAKLNSGNPAYLPYNDVDTDSDKPIASPQRLSPPNFPIAYANTANLAVQEMEAAVGMYKSTFGQQSNSISGRAKIADQTAGETATFHFQDNRRVAQQQVYRIVVDMLPRIYDEARQAKIMGEDGEQDTVMVNPNIQGAVQREGKKVVAINLGVGRYDVRVKIGPSYTTLREEMGTKLQELGKGNPVLAAALTPILMKLGDMPEADKVARIAMAMLPPEVQKAYNEEDGDIPPAAKATIDQQGQHIQAMAQSIEKATQVIQDLQGQVNEKNTIVQNEAKLAMEQIKSAKKDLDHQAQLLSNQEKALQDARRIVQLELELENTGNQVKLKDMLDTEKEKMMAMHHEKMQNAQSESDQAIQALSKAVIQSQEKMAQELAKNTQAIEELQKTTMDAIDDVTETQSAPKTIVKNDAGEPIGVKIGDQIREFIRDSSGSIIGVQGENG